jgi:hypothetical protein
MSTIFLFCALVGGTVLVCQFLMTVAGLGGHDTALGDAAGDDVPHDFGSDGGSHDFGQDAGAHDMHGGDTHDQGGSDQHQSTWLFGIITFRTMVAAMTFFGIGGMAARSGELTLPNQMLIAVCCGIAAMCLVHWMMRTFYRLSEDRTVRISHAIGLEGSVYLPIPGDKAGAGKIHLSLQGRLMEYEAVTAAKAGLPAGARVVVVGARGSSTLEVEPLPEQATQEART